MITHMVFDWNGTVIADTRACMAADNHVLRAFGGTPVDLRTYRDTVNIPAIDFYTQHGCSRVQLVAESARLGQIFHEFYEPRAQKVRTRQGAVELFQWLQGHGITSIIVSNHTVAGISAQLSRLGLKQYISLVLANDALNSSMIGRNKGQKLEYYIAQHRLDPSQVAIIGDSPEETEIGKWLATRYCPDLGETKE